MQLLKKAKWVSDIINKYSLHNHTGPPFWESEGMDKKQREEHPEEQKKKIVLSKFSTKLKPSYYNSDKKSTAE